jgi:dolichyl-phosphate-mannose--protein O-mannosyl transferase
VIRYYHKEHSIHPPIVPPETEKVTYNKPGFIAKFVELNKVMWDTNKGLTSSHPYDSRPEVKFRSLVNIRIY